MSCADKLLTILKVTEPTWYSIVGTSMYPGLSSGQRVLVHPVGSVRLGRVYVYFVDGELRVHRLLQRKAERLVFAGDNSTSIEYLAPSLLIGQVHTENRYLWLLSSLGFLYITLGMARSVLLSKARCACFRAIVHAGARSYEAAIL